MWSRVGDVSFLWPTVSLLWPREYIRQAIGIQYRALSNTKYINRLYITRTPNKHAMIRLVSTYISAKQASSLLFNELSGLEGKPSIMHVGKLHQIYYNFLIQTDSDVTKFIGILDGINKSEGGNAITNDLLTELKNIIKYIQENEVYQPGFNHIISIARSFEELANPEGYKANLLGNIAELCIEENINQSALKKLLSKGNNPNQYYPGGNSVLSQSFRTPEVIRLLLEYGAKPLTRGGDSNLNFIEYCQAYQEHLLPIIDAYISRPERSIELPKISRQDSLTNGSMFELQSGEIIRTYCKKTCYMSRWEWVEFLELYKQYFKTSNTDTLGSELLKEIIDYDKYIDLIFAGERLIGFNIYKLVHLKDYPDTITVYSLYTLICKEYQHTGLGPILDFRFGYAVQCLFPDKNIIFFGLLVSDDAYGMVKRIGIHFPKYVHTGAKRYVKQFLQVAEPKLASRYEHKDIGNWIDGDDVTVRNRRKGALSFFFIHILHYLNGIITGPRSAPCFFVMSGESLSQLDGLAVRLGISLSQVIIDMAISLKRTEHPQPLLSTTYPFSHNTQLFLFRKRIPNRTSKGVEKIADDCKRALNSDKPKL